MRGSGAETGSPFSYVDLAARVPKQHPLRVIRRLVDAALVDPSPAFAALYAPLGRPSIPPERLVQALPLQAFYSVRSGRQLMEQLGYNLLFRWSVGLGIGDPVWDVTTFTKNRERLLDGDTAREFLAALLNRPEVRALLSDEHFPVDGTPIQAWAGMKGFRPRDGSGAPPAPGAATASGTATAGSARTRPTPRPASPRRGCSARGGARRRGRASWATR